MWKNQAEQWIIFDENHKKVVFNVYFFKNRLMLKIPRFGNLASSMIECKADYE
jgi:hypothetical protein